jgi:hypothetical protein
MNQFYQASQIVILADPDTDDWYYLLFWETKLNDLCNIQTILMDKFRFIKNTFHYRRDTLFILAPSAYNCEDIIRGKILGVDFQIEKLKYPLNIDMELILEVLPCTTTKNV